MFKQIILPLLLVAAFIVGVGIFVKNSKDLKFTIIPTPTAIAASQKTMVIGNTTIKIKIEIANNQTLRAKGLSGRTTLEENAGMLFVFDSQNVTPVFWMKDMLIPIDVIWINDGKIVKIDADVKPPKANTEDSGLSTYVSGQPIDYVLEVNAGFSKKNGVKVGDSVQMQFDL